MTAAERREQLLDVTKALALERGFHAVSIEAVAREAGITRPVVYGHFQRPRRACSRRWSSARAERALTQLATVLPPALSGGGRRESAVRRAARATWSAAEADPATWRLVLVPPEGAPAMHARAHRRGRQAAVVAQLAQAVQPGFGAGGGSPDPELTARMLSSFADEAARLLLTDPEQFPVERLLTHARWFLGQLRFGASPTAD